MKNWCDFGYNTKESCCICGKTEDNKIEPRFGYIVCEEHSKLSPVEITKLFTEK